MPEPSHKRARIEDRDGDKNLPPPRKDDGVWLSDGSIVVVAADNVAFRVHKSTLSRRSEVFSDLFSLPNADAATAETMEGCPVVRVSDASKDIRPFFLVLCCGKNYYYDGDTLIAVPFEILDALIRMSHKYAVEDVLDHALSRLKRYYPTDLAAWRDVNSRARHVAAHHRDAFKVVELARLTNTPSLLPTAFLICTNHLTGCLTQQGVPIALGMASLPVSDQALLIGVREQLLQMGSERTLRLLAEAPCAACTTPAACRAAREAPLSAIRQKNSFPEPPLHHRDLLQPMAATLWGDNWRVFCASCQAALTAIDEEESRWIWDNLWDNMPIMSSSTLDEDSWESIEADGT